MAEEAPRPAQHRQLPGAARTDEQRLDEHHDEPDHEHDGVHDHDDLDHEQHDDPPNHHDHEHDHHDPATPSTPIHHHDPTTPSTTLSTRVNTPSGFTPAAAPPAPAPPSPAAPPRRRDRPAG